MVRAGAHPDLFRPHRAGAPSGLRRPSVPFSWPFSGLAPCPGFHSSEWGVAPGGGGHLVLHYL